MNHEKKKKVEAFVLCHYDSNSIHTAKKGLANTRHSLQRKQDAFAGVIGSQTRPIENARPNAESVGATRGLASTRKSLQEKGIGSPGAKNEASAAAAHNGLATTQNTLEEKQRLLGTPTIASSAASPLPTKRGVRRSAEERASSEAGLRRTSNALGKKRRVFGGAKENENRNDDEHPIVVVPSLLSEEHTSGQDDNQGSGTFVDEETAGANQSLPATSLVEAVPVTEDSNHSLNRMPEAQALDQS